MIDIFFDKFEKVLGKLVAVLLILLALNVFLDTALRYLFHISYIFSQELEWHIFSIMFLLGLSYTLMHDAHVRVDFLYDVMNKRKKALVNILGSIFMLIPFALLITFNSWDFVYDSFSLNEVSENPNGLAYRWIIKAFIPFSFVLLVISSISFIRKNIKIYKKA